MHSYVAKQIIHWCSQFCCFLWIKIHIGFIFDCSFFYPHIRICLLILEREERRERERRDWKRCERGNISQLPHICALTRDQTLRLLVYRMMLRFTELPDQDKHLSFFLFLFKLYFVVSAVTAVPIFCPLLHSTELPLIPQAIPTPLSLSMGHACMFIGYPIPYAVLYIPMTVL